MEIHKYKISFCVVCMNRLHHLKQTLKKNLDDNADYSNLEIVLLDYNSQDGMQEWVQENFSNEIKSGLIVYFRTDQPGSWNPSHSKNLAFKLATGDIVCCIWADYYTGYRFAKYVNECFNTDNNVVLTPIDFHKQKKNFNPPGDVLGKVCVKKSDFEKIKGFDERMDKHGFEDYDFINRLEMIGVERVLIEDQSFLKYLSHNDDERYNLLSDNLQSMYINYKTSCESEILFIFKDFTFTKGVVIDNYSVGAENYNYSYKLRDARFEYSLKKPGWERGTWVCSAQTMRFTSNSGNVSHLIKSIETDSLYSAKTGNLFYNIQNNELILGMLRFNHFIYTRSIMEDNLDNEKMIVNSSFGQASVYKNFQSTEVINII